MNGLSNDVEAIADHLTSRQKDFDEVMDLVRGIVRNSAQAITMLHNDEAEKAERTIGTSEDMIKKLKKFDSTFSHQARQAYQEYAEAKIFLNIKLKHEILSLDDTGVDKESYLMGLMDVVGELKREILEELRESRIKEAEGYFDIMRTIYDSTRSIRFAEAILNGFRRKQDVARMQLESAGGEILLFKSKE